MLHNFNLFVRLCLAAALLQELGCENCLLVDFWEAILMASSQEAVIQELLFRLTSVYIDRLTNASLQTSAKIPQTPQRRRPLKTAEDLVRGLKSHPNLVFFGFRAAFCVVQITLCVNRGSEGQIKTSDISVTHEYRLVLPCCWSFRSTPASITAPCTHGSQCSVQRTQPATNTRRRSTNCR